VRRPTRSLLTGLAGLALLAGVSPSSPAGASEWQADTAFEINPREVPGTDYEATQANYRLFGPQGQPIGDVMVTIPPDFLQRVEVPPVPGIYTLEGWLEDAAGKELRRASTALHFDDAVPPPPAPHSPARWLLGDEVAVLNIDPPTGPLPISGTRGYEITLSRGSVHFETSGREVSLGLLPEGVTRAQVVTLSGSGVRSEARTVSFAVDATAPAASLHGLPSGWSNGPVGLTVDARDSLSGMTRTGPAGPFTAIAVDDAAPTITPGATASTWVAGSGVHRVRFYARDGAGNVADGSPGSPAPETALVRIDEVGPRVQFAAAQDPGDPERIEALVADSLSGPNPERGAIGVRPAGTRARLEPLPTRVEPGRLIARWDSDAFAPGKYEFLATGYDVAGNAASGGGRLHGGRMVLVNPLKAQVSLVSKLAGRRLSGTLRRASGGPLAGQTIAIEETFAAGADQRQRTTYVHTGEDGGFSLHLKPGPSRRATASFAGTRLLSRASSDASGLAAATAIRFHASAATAKVGGRPVVFSGKVAAAGARGAVAGLPVELQFDYPGAGWSAFRTVEVDARGRFRYAYRFSDDDSRGVRFRFRAYVKGREGWPYGPGTSRPLSVRGR
jgi:hypothetical protein